MIEAMKLQPNDGPRLSLGIGPGLDDVVEPRREFARRFTKGIRKLVGNMSRLLEEDQKTHRKNARGCRIGGIHPYPGIRVTASGCQWLNHLGKSLVPWVVGSMAISTLLLRCNRRERMGSRAGNSLVVAAKVATVEAPKDQAELYRWNHAMWSLQQQEKDNMGVEQWRTGGESCAERAKRMEASLNKVMYWDCWGPK
ncbi:hypothetical protein B296_00036810 [Ensete ventricosum]|uniref:Uncharacterized protein n=2 Tax=Ensete ventricosum TaxID=4639 RepID=A0A426YGV5_ENSVE|nr:hypothetical protein B296_00036810 [Ensete ventricosum]